MSASQGSPDVGDDTPYVATSVSPSKTPSSSSQESWSVSLPSVVTTELSDTDEEDPEDPRHARVLSSDSDDAPPRLRVPPLSLSSLRPLASMH